MEQSTYAQLLNSQEWKERRQVILSRDNFLCQNCDNVKLLAGTQEGKIVINNLSLNPEVFSLEDSRPVGSYLISNAKRRELLGDRSSIEFSAYYNIDDQDNFEEMTTLVDYAKSKQAKQIKKIVGPNGPFMVLLNETGEKIDSLPVSKNSRDGKIDDYRVDDSQTSKVCVTRKKFYVIAVKGSDDQFILVQGLHVHHKYYQYEKLPWEYADEALITFCFKCHEEVHGKQKIPVYDKHGNATGEFMTPCSRCSGAGWFHEYKHVQAGICFRCNGARYEELINVER